MKDPKKYCLIYDCAIIVHTYKKTDGRESLLMCLSVFKLISL